MIDVVEVGPDQWQLWRSLRRSALGSAADAFGASLADWSGVGDTEHRWRERLSTVPYNAVLHLDGTPAGMVSVLEEDGAAELISMWVEPAARGRGVGDTAVRAAIAWTAAHRPGEDLWLSVRYGNEHAAALYRRHGFVDAGPSSEDPLEYRMRRGPGH